MPKLFCKSCGGILNPDSVVPQRYKCVYCGTAYQPEVAEAHTNIVDAFDQTTQNLIKNLLQRRHSLIHAETVNTKMLLRVCTELLNYLPDDAVSSMGRIVTESDAQARLDAIRSVDVGMNDADLEEVILLLVKTVPTDPASLSTMNALLDRAYARRNPSLFETYTALLAARAPKPVPAPVAPAPVAPAPVAPAPAPEPQPAPAPQPQAQPMPEPQPSTQSKPTPPPPSTPQPQTPPPAKSKPKSKLTFGFVLGSWILSSLPFLIPFVISLFTKKNTDHWMWLTIIWSGLSLLRALTCTTVLRGFFSFISILCAAALAFSNEPLPLLLLCIAGWLFFAVSINKGSDNVVEAEFFWFSAGILISICLFLYPKCGVWVMIPIGIILNIATFISVLYHFLKESTKATRIRGALLLLCFLAATSILSTISRETTYVAISIFPLLFFYAIGFFSDLKLSRPLAILLLIASVCCIPHIAMWGVVDSKVKDDTAYYNLGLDTDTLTVGRAYGVTVLGDVDRPLIDTLIIEEGYTTLAKRSLSNCGKLETLYLPAGMTVISEKALAGCGDLLEIYIGYNPDGTPSATHASLREIGESALKNCPLRTIHFNGTAKEWEAVKKGEGWDDGVRKYEVVCIDTTLEIDGKAE